MRIEFFIAILLSSSVTTAAPIDVYIMAGQSNMVGGGGLNELPEPLAAPQTDVDFWWWTPFRDPDLWNGWVTLAPSPPSSGSTYSAELSFARKLADANPDRRIAIIKVAQNGTSLGKDWHPDEEANRWGAKLFDRLIDETHAALDALTLASPQDTITIKGMGWIQGDSDSRSESFSAAYADNLQIFADTIRVELESPQLPLMISQLHDASPNIYSDVVREQQLLYAANDPLAYLVEVDDLVMKTDNIHLTGTSRLEIGDRFARIAISIELPPGDMDGNGVVDAFDVAPFELALADKQSYLSLYPNLSPQILGDFDGNDLIDAFDVPGFEAKVALSGATVPEPESLIPAVSGLMILLGRGYPSSSSPPTSRASSITA